MKALAAFMLLASLQLPQQAAVQASRGPRGGSSWAQPPAQSRHLSGPTRPDRSSGGCFSIGKAAATMERPSRSLPPAAARLPPARLLPTCAWPALCPPPLLQACDQTFMDALDGGDTWLLKEGLKLTGYADKLPDPSIGGWLAGWLGGWVAGWQPLSGCLAACGARLLAPSASSSCSSCCCCWAASHPMHPVSSVAGVTILAPSDGAWWRFLWDNGEEREGGGLAPSSAVWW